MPLFHLAGTGANSAPSEAIGTEHGLNTLRSHVLELSPPAAIRASAEAERVKVNLVRDHLAFNATLQLATFLQRETDPLRPHVSH